MTGNLILRGQFTPENGGQFVPEKWGQFGAENGGQYQRNFHIVNIINYLPKKIAANICYFPNAFFSQFIRVFRIN
jgi:hypothetical protein